MFATWLPCAALVALAACAQDSLVLPDEGEPSQVLVLSGNGQSGQVGAPLTDSLVVRLTDSHARPVQDFPVVFAITSGGQVIPDTARTDADGRASSRWILGPAAGAQTVEATVPLSGKSPRKALFSAQAMPGPADTVAATAGDAQTGQAGSTLADSLVVVVQDAYGNGIADVPLTWQVSGGGTVSPAGPATDAGGRQAATWTLGTTAATQTVTVTGAGVPGAMSFTATATTGPPPALAIVTQPSATASNGVPFSQQPVIQLEDAGGTPIGQAGVLVTAGIATGGGVLGGTTSITTNSSGRAVFTDLAISGTPGSRTIVFGASGHVSVTSAAINVTGGPPDPGQSTLSASPTTITASSGAVTSTLTVTARDAQGNPVPGATVLFTASGGGVQLTQPTGPTNVNGVATGRASSGAAGAKTIHATVDGIGLNQAVTLTVVPSGAAAAHSTATVPSGTTGSTTSIAIQLRDQFDNPLGSGGDNVAVSVTGANTASATVADNHDGTYTATYTPAAPGIDHVAITLNGTGISGSPYTSTVSGGPSASRSSVSASPGSITASNGSSVSTVAVTVRDAAGTPLQGVAVTISVSGKNNTINQPAGPTNAQGVATATFSSTKAETKTVTATAGGQNLSQGATVTVTPAQASAQTTTVATPGGKPFNFIPITITAKDAFGNAHTTGGLASQITVSVTGANNVGRLNVADNGDGTYSASYLALFKGNDDVVVTLYGVAVAGSPFQSHIK